MTTTDPHKNNFSKQELFTYYLRVEIKENSPEIWPGRINIQRYYGKRIVIWRCYMYFCWFQPQSVEIRWIFNLLLINLPHLSFWLKQKWYQLCSLIHRLKIIGKNVLHEIFLQLNVQCPILNLKFQSYPYFVASLSVNKLYCLKVFFFN